MNFRSLTMEEPDDELLVADDADYEPARAIVYGASRGDDSSDTPRPVRLLRYSRRWECGR